MNREAFKLARDTLRTAVKDYAWRRVRESDFPCYGYHTGPGKFEGEHWSIVHWYGAMMNGGGDEPLMEGDTVVADLFEVLDLERAAFALTESQQFAVLWHSPSGFETLEYVDANAYDKLREQFTATESES